MLGIGLQDEHALRDADQAHHDHLPTAQVPLAIQPLTAFDAEAVPPQVVVTARWADQPAGRIGLQPALALATVPNAVLGPEHPASALAVQHRQIAHREPEGPGFQAPTTALHDQVAVARLGLGERIDSHAQSIARQALLGSGSGRCPV